MALSQEALLLSPTLSLLCLSIVTWTQVGHWRNNITLFDHALKVNDRNIIAYNNRANAYADFGNNRQTIEDCDKAIELNAKYASAYYHRAIAYGRFGNHRQAIEDFKIAARLGNESAQKLRRNLQLIRQRMAQARSDPYTEGIRLSVLEVE